MLDMNVYVANRRVSFRDIIEDEQEYSIRIQQELVH